MGAQPDGVVEVTWPKDARRLRAALLETPVFRRMRTIVVGVTVASLALAAVLALGGIRSPVLLWMAAPPVSFAGVYAAALRNELKEVGVGSITWTFAPAGLRIAGDTATEIPWPRLVRWYRRADHLIVETQRSSGRRPHLACAAPLAALDAPTWEQVEAMLREHLGPEGDPSR